MPNRPATNRKAAPANVGTCARVGPVNPSAAVHPSRTPQQRAAGVFLITSDFRSALAYVRAMKRRVPGKPVSVARWRVKSSAEPPRSATSKRRSPKRRSSAPTGVPASPTRTDKSTLGAYRVWPQRRGKATSVATRPRLSEVAAGSGGPTALEDREAVGVSPNTWSTAETRAARPSQSRRLRSVGQALGRTLPS